MPRTDARASATDDEARRLQDASPRPATSGPASASMRDHAYVPFGNVEARNGLQALVEVPLLVRALRLPRGGRVLEIGCGRGVALPVLARLLAPSALVGVDVDAALVELAKRRVRDAGIGARLIEGDARALPLATASVDLVIDFGTCYHVGGGAAGARAALREVARVLRPGGLFVYETPVAQHLAHPLRSFRRTLPWRDVPELVRDRTALVWAVRRRRANGDTMRESRGDGASSRPSPASSYAAG